MALLRSSLDPGSDAFRANADAMRALVADLRHRTRGLSERGAGGDDRSIARHRERGKLPVRERIDRLIDPVTPLCDPCGIRRTRHTTGEVLAGNRILER